METGELLAGLERDGAAIHSAGQRDLGALVPTCEGWTVEDVVRHTGRVYRSVAAIVSSRSQVIIPAEQTPAGPTGAASVDWFADAHGTVVEALSAVDPEEVLWTWAGLLPAMFYFRRMAHETAIHAFDAESAFGDAALPESDLACDGVDEYFERVLPFTLSRWSKDLPAGSLHLHRTDGAGEWTLELIDGVLDVAKEHAKGDAAVKGSGGALFLFVWNRQGLGELETFGDEDVATAWAALAP